MGQDTSEKATAEVDIDNLEVEILILAKEPSRLRSTAAFLSRRGWPTEVMNDVQKAIGQISKKKPDYILISCDHPAPAFAKLPELIQGSFGVECIGFIEGSGNSSNQKLNNARTKHKLQGQPSGPTCQRTIRRLLAEKFNVATEERSHEDLGGHDNANVTIRGGSGAGDDENANREVHGAANLATSVLKGSAPTEAEGSDGVVSNGKYRIAQQGARRSLKDLTGQKHDEKESAEKARELLEKLGEAPAFPLAQESKAEELLAHAGAVPLEVGENHAPPNKVETINESISIFETAVREAIIEFSLALGDAQGALPLTTISRLAVFPIDSLVWPGYLVMAIQYSELIQESIVIEKCHEYLQKSFAKYRIEAKIENKVLVNVPATDFKSWTAESADFTLYPSYYGYEFGLAFFRAAKSLPKAQALEENNMFGIDVGAISTDEPVNFKAYLYLRKNQKYFLYLRSGRTLQPEQKTRLMESQVDSFYMKSIDLENLRAFLAGNYLRDSLKKKSS